MAQKPGEKTCFIAMPVTTTKAHADLFGDEDHWTHVMESLFVPAIEAAGFVPWRPVARGSHLIHAEIVRQLERADMVLCDLSQNNPNVFFELGVRTSVNKPIALVRCDADAPIPFDVSGINTHPYDPSLRAWLIDSEIAKLTAHLLEAEVSCGGENPMWRQFGLVLKAQEPSASETREDAMLSLVSGQLTDLSNRVDEIARDRDLERNVFRRREVSLRDFGDNGAPTPSLRAHNLPVNRLYSPEEIQQRVDDLAVRYGVEARLDLSQDEAVITIRGSQDQNHKFRNHARVELAEWGVPLRFRFLAPRGDQPLSSN